MKLAKYISINLVLTICLFSGLTADPIKSGKDELSVELLMNSQFIGEHVIESNEAYEIIEIQTTNGRFWKVISKVVVRNLSLGIELGCIGLVRNKFFCRIVSDLASMILAGEANEFIEENLAWVTSPMDDNGSWNGSIYVSQRSEAFEAGGAFIDHKENTHFPWHTPDLVEVDLDYSLPSGTRGSVDPRSLQFDSEFFMQPSLPYPNIIQKLLSKSVEEDYDCLGKVGQGVSTVRLYELVERFKVFVDDGGRVRSGCISLGDELDRPEQGQIRTNFQIPNNQSLVAIMDLTPPPKSISGIEYVSRDPFEEGIAFTDQGIYVRWSGYIRGAGVLKLHWSCLRQIVNEGEISWDDDLITFYIDPPGLFNECSESFRVWSPPITLAEIVKLITDASKL